MLYTNLKHLENSQEHARAIQEHENVMVICGRMEHGCIAVFRIAEELEAEYPEVSFFDMEFDNPESMVVRSLPHHSGSLQLPLIVLYKNAVVVHFTSGIMTREEMIGLLDLELTDMRKVQQAFML